MTNHSEEWKAVYGFEDSYEISNFGNIKRTKPSQGTKVGRLSRGKKGNADGYLRFNFCDKPKPPQERMVHDVVLETFVGPKPDGCEARHLDGNPSNNTLTNLMWGTPLENAADRVKHGTDARGVKSVNSRLTASDVFEIRQSPLPQKELGRMFGVSQQHISDIKNNKRWSYQ